MKRFFLTLSLPLIALLGWWGYGEAIPVPSVKVREITPLAPSGSKNLPFFELMSPLPANVGGWKLVPKLEYKKGPPQRYIERISLLLQKEEGRPSERMIFFGRRTILDWPGMFLLPDSPTREALYLKAAILESQGLPSGLSAMERFLLRPMLRNEAARWLTDATEVAVMDQAGSPAFLIRKESPDFGRQATALFFRRNAYYRVDYEADQVFAALDPETLFRQSFLVENRAEAVGYVARNLSAIKLERSQASEISAIAWPVLLLTAHVSVDPSSLEAFFHFAGINALLYRSLAGSAQNSEVLDVLKNNVLAAEFYAKDVGPDSAQTAEISRLVRMLTQ
jgi:hypothetical protein